MPHLLDRDQAQRLASYEAIKEIYLSGIGDGFDGRLPMMAEITYLQGYCVGMQQLKTTDFRLAYSPIEQTESPLVCGQCSFFNNDKCTLKGITRNSNLYACDRINVDCPF
jgi:hypothetical protein